MQEPLIPSLLTPGDSIGLVAPAGPVDSEAQVRAVNALEERGFRCQAYGDLSRRDDYLAGSDEARAAEINAAIADPTTKAILPVRGGYGVSRILDKIDYEALRRQPKLICGFSDITALHAAVYKRIQLATFHGPNLQDGIGHTAGLVGEAGLSYWRLFGAKATRAQSDSEPPTNNEVLCLSPGQCSGPLIGGNLAVLSGLIGTPYQLDTTGAILLLEDVGEAPYRIDRMLCQLRLAGMLDGLAGAMIGQFTDCHVDKPAAIESSQKVIQHYFSELGIPVIYNYPVGHIRENTTLPLGIRIHLDATEGLLDTMSAIERAYGKNSGFP